MRDPDNIIRSSEIVNDNTLIVIDNLPEYTIQEYDLMDEKELRNYFNHIEKQVIRGSREYKKFIQYIREYMDMNKCSYYQNVNNIDTSKVKIHIHHDPITLDDIVIVVYNKRSACRESLDEEMVAKEVMYLHYCLLVGLIPLAETIHELVHNKYLFIPTTKVMGKYNEFVEGYKEYFLPEQLEKLKKIEEASLESNYDYETLLNRNFIYLDISGAYSLPQYSDVVNMMKNTIANNRQEEKSKTLITPGYFDSIH